MSSKDTDNLADYIISETQESKRLGASPHFTREVIWDIAVWLSTRSKAFNRKSWLTKVGKAISH